ncbi:hypothetical protein R3P38DRAFT_919748 [Favolaschia claudopus]|uniref:DUF6534 domain-containing protein n=1 Tax=Favolaschia claudopus TaxID=2862362 RepID=A0AAW0BQ15_9AGAR
MASVDSFNAYTTIGAYLIGVLVSYLLLGVATSQAYGYYHRFPTDSLQLKFLVGFVWLCSVAHVVLNGHALFVFMISDLTHPDRIFDQPTPKSFETVFLFYGLIAACVQGFFSYRIYAFSKKLHIPILIWILVFVHLLSCTGSFAMGLRAPSLPAYQAETDWLAIVGWTVGATCDVLITVTLVILLYRQRTTVTRRSTLAQLDKLILWSLETGLMTSITATLALICFIAMKRNFLYLTFFAIEPQVVVNSLLATLNSREALRAMNECEVDLTIPMAFTEKSMHKETDTVVSDKEDQSETSHTRSTDSPV